MFGTEKPLRSHLPGPAIVPALPFLTLIQLARLGFTEPAAAALAAARVVAPAHVFAAAVAGKVLEPPGRGWARDERELDAVRLASGLERDEVDVGLAELAAASDVVAPSVARRARRPLRRRTRRAMRTCT